MLAPPLPAGAGLVIVPSSSIHTQFMRFPIDVLYVNKEDVIVGIDRNLRPWRIGRFYKRVHYVVELPAGGAAGCQVGIGWRSRDWETRRKGEILHWRLVATEVEPLTRSE